MSCFSLRMFNLSGPFFPSQNYSPKAESRPSTNSLQSGQEYCSSVAKLVCRTFLTVLHSNNIECRWIKRKIFDRKKINVKCIDKNCETSGVSHKASPGWPRMLKLKREKGLFCGLLACPRYISTLFYDKHMAAYRHKPTGEWEKLILKPVFSTKVRLGCWERRGQTEQGGRVLLSCHPPWCEGLLVASLPGWPPPDSGQRETERFCALAELRLPVTRAKPSSPFPQRLTEATLKLSVYFFRWVKAVSSADFSVAFN